jgi:hypothetical protein
MECAALLSSSIAGVLYYIGIVSKGADNITDERSRQTETISTENEAYKTIAPTSILRHHKNSNSVRRES